MGYGDEIMVTGMARVMQKTDPRPVAVADQHGYIRWSTMWRSNPRMVHPNNMVDNPDLDVQWIRNHCNSRRPYIKYNGLALARPRWFYTKWKCSRGEIYLNDKEHERGMKGVGYVIVEPHIKKGASPNKCWGFEKTQIMVDILRKHVPVAQVGHGLTTKRLDNVTFINTKHFRRACGVIFHSLGYVGPEGGLHHAAAVFHKPAVVIFGGMTSPKNTGYDFHTNIVDEGNESPCGMIEKCRHCDRIMQSIMPKFIAEKVREML